MESKCLHIYKTNAGVSLCVVVEAFVGFVNGNECRSYDMERNKIRQEIKEQNEKERVS